MDSENDLDSYDDIDDNSIFSEENNISDDNYEFKCPNISANLLEKCNDNNKKLVKTITINNNTWIPPTKYGLDNSQRILPNINIKNNIYETTKNNILVQNNLVQIKNIKDDIMNFKKLMPSQLNLIKNISDNEKYEIIELYNHMVIKFKELFSK